MHVSIHAQDTAIDLQMITPITNVRPVMLPALLVPAIQQVVASLAMLPDLDKFQVLLLPHAIV